MQPFFFPYRCRLCGAASYRRLTHRGADGTMGYSGLYSCSGCSATFADPSAWRQASESAKSVDGEGRRSGSGIGPTDNAGPVPELFASWGGTPTATADSAAYGYNDADTRAIQAAAARADKSKRRKSGR